MNRIAPDVLALFATLAFHDYYASLGWRLKRPHAFPTEAEYAQIGRAGLVEPQRLQVSDLARMHALCRALAELPVEGHAAWVEACFRLGDNREREALLTGLVLLPEPERFRATAVDACRAAVQSTFEAIACENAYPAKYFPQAAFRAMVLKALHLGVDVHRIVGLTDRLDAELAGMASDYASELRAAGKAVPADIEFVLSKGEQQHDG